MQKFVIKKITRSTNITIEDQNFLDAEALSDDVNLEKTSVRMCGYLKKKRNVSENSNYLSYGHVKNFHLLHDDALRGHLCGGGHSCVVL